MKRDSFRHRTNFLPLEMRPSLASYRNFLLLLAVAAVGVPLLALAVKVSTLHTERELASQRAEKEELAAQVQALIKQKEESSDHKTLDAVRKALAERVYWAEVFRELGNVAPKTLWLTEFETKADATGRSIVISGSSGSQSDIAEFLANLESSYYFREVQMRYAEADEGKSPLLFRFQFEGKIFDPQGGEPDAKD